MQNSPLFVVFHAASTNADDGFRSAFRKAALRAAPDAACVQTTPEMIENSRKPAADPFHFTTHVNGTDADDAMRIVRDLSRGRKVAVVTLCDDMIRAAAREDFSVVTVGLRQACANRQYVAASPDHIGDMLRLVKREKSL